MKVSELRQALWAEKAYYAAYEALKKRLIANGESNRVAGPAAAQFAYDCMVEGRPCEFPDDVTVASLKSEEKSEAQDDDGAFAAAVKWVANNMGDEAVQGKDAPSRLASNLLSYARTEPKEFWSRFAAKFLVEKEKSDRVVAQEERDARLDQLLVEMGG